MKELIELNRPLALSTFTDPVPSTASRKEFETVRVWAENWLSKSHPELGRSGAICPYSGSSIKKNLFRLAFLRGTDLDHARMVGLLEHVAHAFPSLPPMDGPDALFKAVLLVFPEVTEFDQIDAVHAECKSAFVKRGLMVGQFYPGHQEKGLRNPDFRPLNAPFAMLAVRNMVVTDFPFLCDNDEWTAAYRARFEQAGATLCPHGKRSATTAPVHVPAATCAS